MNEQIRKFHQDTVRFTVDLDKELHKELKQLALDEQCHATDVVRYAINQFLASRRDR